MLNIGCGRTTLVAAAVSLAVSEIALAQIATDGTLGPAQALSGPKYAIKASLGRQVGTNLFHSFSTFNLNSSERATFYGPSDISNIISRVTGGSASTIDGLLRSKITGANLFLINPKGILFGPNASLELSGSFHASTANYIKLADGGRFDATSPAASVLTMAPPAAFGFLGPAPAPLSVQGSTLTVPEGGSLSLVGGAVHLADASVRTAAGDVRLVAMGGAGEVPINATGSSLAGVALAPITVERSALATESGSGNPPGRIVIRGGQVTVLESAITSINREAPGAPPVEISGTGAVTVSASQLASTTEGAGRGADLTVHGENVTIDRATQISADTFGDGRGGDILLAARQAVLVNGMQDDPDFINIFSMTYAGGASGDIHLTGDTVTARSANVFSGAEAAGDAGSIRIEGRDVQLLAGNWLYSYANSSTSGKTGAIDIAASERVRFNGLDWFGNLTEIFTLPLGSGDARHILVSAPEINVGAANIESVAFGSGNSGSVLFRGDVIRFIAGDGGHARAANVLASTSSGNGGDIEIRAARSFELNGAGFANDWTHIVAATEGSGQGGRIIVDAPSIVIDTATLFSRTRFGTGAQGDIMVRADDLRLQHEGGIGSVTEGSAKGSAVRIDATSVLLTDTSGIGSNAVSTGNAGSITINAQRVKLTGASSIDVSASGGGTAGDIVLNIGEVFEMSDRKPGTYLDLGGGGPRGKTIWPGGVSSRAHDASNAGNVLLTAPAVVLDDGRIRTSVAGAGRGGSVGIKADNLVMKNGGQVDARASASSSGDAGAIDISVKGRFEIAGLSPIDGAFSGLYAETQGSGRGGTVDVAADTFVLDRGLIRSTAAGSGAAGTIRIRAGDVSIVFGGWFDAGTAPGSSGAGGSIDIAADRSIEIRGIDRSAPLAISPLANLAPAQADSPIGREQSAWRSTVSSNSSGMGLGGNVALSAPRITLEDGARVSANSISTGNAGNILVTAPGSLNLNGGSITTQAEIGAGGNITLYSPRIAIDAGSSISASSSGAGNAGNILVQAPEWLKLNGGSITTQAASGDGGNISIIAGDRVHLQNAEISTSVGGGEGSGGNIFIDPTFVILESSRATANAFGGAGGNIRIISDVFLASPDSVIDASSRLGISGIIQIAALRTDPNAALAPLPSTVFDVSALLRESCTGRAGPRASSLVGVGRGGLAEAPSGYMASRYFADAPPPLADTGESVIAAARPYAAPALSSALLSAICGRNS